MKVLCVNKNLFSKDGFSLLKNNNLKLSYSDNLNNINLYDVLLIRADSNLIGKISENTKLKYIISVTTGTNHLDIRFLSRKKIKLFYLKNKSFLSKVKATSEHTIFLILSALRKINTLNNQKLNFKKKYLSNEIANSKIGILGYGRIGKHVARILKSFGARVFIFEKKNIKVPNYIQKYNSIRDLFINSDIISLHIPLNDENYNLVNYKNIKYLKNKFLINTSRAEIINEQSLVRMIKAKKIHYFTDVIHDEHLPLKHNKLAKLKSYDNLFITPHVGGITEESIRITDLYLINLFLNDLKKK